MEAKREFRKPKEKITQAMKLLKEASDISSDKISSTIQDEYYNSKQKLKDKASEMNVKLKQKANDIDTEVKDHPWKYVGLSAAIGAATGFILGKNK